MMRAVALKLFAATTVLASISPVAWAARLASRRTITKPSASSNGSLWMGMDDAGIISPHEISAAEASGLIKAEIDGTFILARYENALKCTHRSLTKTKKRNLILRYNPSAGHATYTFEYTSRSSNKLKESFDLCVGDVRIGLAPHIHSAAFRLYAKYHAYANYAFKLQSDADAKKWTETMETAMRNCNKLGRIIKEGVVHKVLSAYKRLSQKKKLANGYILVLRTQPAEGSEAPMHLLEYYSPSRAEPETFNLCDGHISAEATNYRDTTDVVMIRAPRRKYVFKPSGLGEGDDSLAQQDWVNAINTYIDSCGKTHPNSPKKLPSFPPQGSSDLGTDQDTQPDKTDEIEEIFGGPKVQFRMIDVTKQNLLQMKDVLVASEPQIPLKKTLMAFDFDLTLRDDSPSGGSVLRQNKTTRELLQWAKSVGIPVIVVTARHPRHNVWQRTYEQAKDELQIEDLLGQHVVSKPPLVSEEQATDCTGCKTVDVDSSNGQGSFRYVEGHGVICSGYSKGEAILHYVEANGLDIDQIVFADDYVTNTFNVAQLMGATPHLNRIHAIWYAPFDYEKGREEILKEAFDKSDALMKCLEAKTWSECQTEFVGSWCDVRLDDYLGDNSFNPRQPQNLFNLFAVRDLGHFPATDTEVARAQEIRALAQEDDDKISALRRKCNDAKRDEESTKKKEALAALAASGQKPCCSAVQCMLQKAKPAQQRTCDIDAARCCDQYQR